MNTPNALPSPPVAWWRVPQMWLVVGGPLVVVVASLVTAVIAVKYADPVIDKTALNQQPPAQKARNHAASPVVPKDR